MPPRARNYRHLGVGLGLLQRRRAPKLARSYVHPLRHELRMTILSGESTAAGFPGLHRQLPGKTSPRFINYEPSSSTTIIRLMGRHRDRIAIESRNGRARLFPLDGETASFSPPFPLTPSPPLFFLNDIPMAGNIRRTLMIYVMAIITNFINGKLSRCYVYVSLN